MRYWNWMRYGLLSNKVPISVGCGLRSAAGPARLSPISSATAVKKAANRFGVPSLMAIKKPTATAIFGALIKKCSRKKRTVASAKIRGRPIMSNVGTTRFASGWHAIPVKHCHFQSLMNTMLGSPICSSENII